MTYRLAMLVAAPLLAALTTQGTALADPVATPAPPYIDQTQWTSYGSNRTSLLVYPTAAGRDLAGQLGKTAAQTSEAWSEVIKLAPKANTPSMRAQFVCHWRFSEFANPGKASWNLEPWRPVVDDNTMILSGCNPGGSEEPA